jgi:sigma-B regulation protein RsbU (phosphoserine phosphatase)
VEPEVTTTEIARAAFERALQVDDPEALYEQAPCGYLTTRADGLIVKANQTILTWTGHTADDLVGRQSVADLDTTGTKVFHETHLRPMLHLHGRVTGIAVDLLRADGTRLPALLNAVMDRAGDGTPGLIRFAVFDATERRRYEQELLAQKRRAEESEQRLAVVARTLQETLMPPRNPRIDGLDVATGYRPAGTGDEIGGDFYDVFELSSRDWVVTIGDVAGKGVEAAVVATLARHTIRAVATSQPVPSRILDQLNQVVLAHPSGRFLTAAVLCLRRVGDSWSVSMSLGGHPPAILLDLDDAPRTIGDPAHLIGAFDFADYEDVRFDLRPGATLLLHTDGVTDAVDPDDPRRVYGEERLMRLLHDHRDHPAALVDRILRDVLGFQRATARDDIALVALRVPAPGRTSTRAR